MYQQLYPQHLQYSQYSQVFPKLRLFIYLHTSYTVSAAVLRRRHTFHPLPLSLWLTQPFKLLISPFRVILLHIHPLVDCIIVLAMLCYFIHEFIVHSLDVSAFYYAPNFGFYVILRRV